MMWCVTVIDTWLDPGYWKDLQGFSCKRKAKRFARHHVGLHNIVVVYRTEGESF